MLTKTLTKGDVGIKELFNVKKRNSSGVLVAFNLTDYTITIDIYDVTRITFIVSGASCAIQDATNGQVAYTLQSASTATVARYLGRLKFVKGSELFYSKEFQWVVEDRK